MTDLLPMLAGAAPAIAVVVASTALVIFAIHQSRRKVVDAARWTREIIDLTATGKLDDARERARVRMPNARPIVETLFGSTEIRRVFPLRGIVPACLVLVVPSGALLGQLFLSLNAVDPKSRIESVVAFLVAISVVLPLSVGAAFVVGSFAIDATRIVENAALAILAERLRKRSGPATAENSDRTIETTGRRARA